VALNPAPSQPGNGRRLSCSVGQPRRGIRHLGANVVVELYTESRTRKSSTRAWAIIRRADRGHRLAGQRVSRADRRHTDLTGPADRTSRFQQSQEQEMAADTR
jgi:hypothetical protein